MRFPRMLRLVRNAPPLPPHVRPIRPAQSSQTGERNLAGRRMRSRGAAQCWFRLFRLIALLESGNGIRGVHRGGRAASGGLSASWPSAPRRRRCRRWPSGSRATRTATSCRNCRPSCIRGSTPRPSRRSSTSMSSWTGWPSARAPTPKRPSGMRAPCFPRLAGRSARTWSRTWRPSSRAVLIRCWPRRRTGTWTSCRPASSGAASRTGSAPVSLPPGVSPTRCSRRWRSGSPTARSRTSSRGWIHCCTRRCAGARHPPPRAHTGCRSGHSCGGWLSGKAPTSTRPASTPRPSSTYGPSSPRWRNGPGCPHSLGWSQPVWRPQAG